MQLCLSCGIGMFLRSSSDLASMNLVFPTAFAGSSCQCTSFPMFACLKFVLWLLQLWLCAGVSGNLPDLVTEYVRAQFPKEVLQHLGWDKDLGHQVFSIKRIYHSYELFAGTAGITHAFKTCLRQTSLFEIKINSKQDLNKNAKISCARPRKSRRIA